MNVKYLKGLARAQKSNNQREVLLLFRSQKIALTVHDLHSRVSRMNVTNEILWEALVGQTELQKCF